VFVPNPAQGEPLRALHRNRSADVTPIDLLLKQLDQAYDRRSWHGTNLRGSIRGLSARDAAWRPRPGRHNIHEVVVHAAYWKYAVRRRLTAATRGSFPLKGSNWFLREAADESQWRADVRLLEQMHRTLRSAVAQVDPATLESPAQGASVTIQALVSGIIAHDLYHAGQIQLLKRLRK
jgi:uncharacterized damage-inducible protein DinB